MTDPKIIAFLKKEIKERVSKGDNKMAQRMGFGGGFGPNNPDPTVYVFWGSVNDKGEVAGRIMEQNFTMAMMVYSKHGFMNVAKKRLAQGDVYAVIKCEDNDPEPKLLLIKKSGI